VVRDEKVDSSKLMCIVGLALRKTRWRTKDPVVRAAATKAIRSYHDNEVARSVALLFADAKRRVQFSGAAAYLVCVRAVAMPPPLR
jgi:hypothetical protein